MIISRHFTGQFIGAAIVCLAALVATPPASIAADVEGKAVSVTAAWARATPGGSNIGAAYVEFSGLKTASGDKLTGASSPVAGRVEIHTHEMKDGVMSMRKLEQIAVAPGKQHSLAPGGDHLMLFDLKAPLKQGETFPLTLKFETSGDLTVDVLIESMGAMSAHETAGAAPAAGATNDMDGSHAGSGDGR